MTAPGKKLSTWGYPTQDRSEPHGLGPGVNQSLLLVSQADGQRNVLRAFDKQDGRVIAEIDLPARPWGTPMTYLQDGRQFVVIASGEAQNAQLTALALP